MLECNVCGQEFEPVSSNNVVCSDACRQERRKENLRQLAEGIVAPPAPRPCTVCGKEFQPKNGLNVVCSTACRQKKNRAYSREQWIKHKKWEESQRKVRPCTVCGEMFRPKSRRHFVCGEPCRRQERIAASRKFNEKRKTARHCSVCGDVLPSSRHKYCEDLCQRVGEMRLAAEQKRVRAAAEMREANLRERLLRKAKRSKEMPSETSYAAEIAAYLKKGKKITKIPSVWAKGAIYEDSFYEESETELDLGG